MSLADQISEMRQNFSQDWQVRLARDCLGFRALQNLVWEQLLQRGKTIFWWSSLLQLGLAFVLTTTALVFSLYLPQPDWQNPWHLAFVISFGLVVLFGLFWIYLLHLEQLLKLSFGQFFEGYRLKITQITRLLLGLLFGITALLLTFLLAEFGLLLICVAGLIYLYGNLGLYQHLQLLDNFSWKETFRISHKLCQNYFWVNLWRWTKFYWHLSFAAFLWLGSLFLLSSFGLWWLENTQYPNLFLLTGLFLIIFLVLALGFTAFWVWFTAFRLVAFVNLALLSWMEPETLDHLSGSKQPTLEGLRKRFAKKGSVVASQKH